MLKINQIVSGKIDAMAFGGEGILRHDGVVVFIPFAALGDEVEAEVTQVKSSFARGTLRKIVLPSTNRISPRCVHFGVCGGCQLQHVSYETQLQLKHEWVEQALRRIAKSDVEVLPVQGTNAQWNYRRVVKLRFGADLKLSYVNASSNGLTPVESCSIFSEDAQLWKELNAFVGSLFKDTRISSGVVSLFRASAEKLVALVEIDDVKTPQFSLPSVLQGCIIKTPRKTLSVGDVTLSFVQHGLEFVYTPLSFVQSHPEQSAKLSQQVIDEVVSSGAKSVFDLYSGFGISAIALAKDGLRVTGVESNPESIRLAKLNAQTNDVQVDWVCDDVASFLRASKHQSPDVIIVNPPRTGLDAKVTEMLAKSKAHKIIYVSCMPQTLARDLAILSKSGYNVDSCQPYDMFPQTTHVETVAVLNITR